MKKDEEIATTNEKEIEGLISRIEDNQLSAGDKKLVARLLRLVLVLLRMVEGKNASIARLKKFLFGPRTEKRQSTAKENKEESSASSAKPGTENNSIANKQEQQRKKPGHGRLAAKKYPAANRVYLKSALIVGEGCPDECCSGHLYDTNEPQILIKRTARPIIDATIYEKQVLRCSRCQQRFAALLPDNISEEKFDPSADVMIAITHYGASLPFYRLAKLQSIMGMPLPASTQFQRCEIVANIAHPIYLEMERQAARSDLLDGDDTSVRILSLIKENKTLSELERKGMQTTGIGARSDKFEIVLYFSGRKYMGENLSQLLEQRPLDLTEPKIMADAANKNWTKKFRAIICKCLAHGRRKFVDCETAFPNECATVLDLLAEVYKIDAQTKKMTALERLAHHQQYSKPIMDELKQWLETQTSEPNSVLGKAIKYLIRHWPYLTRFLQYPNAPLDNNFIERSLRRVVIMRKNSLFYKTSHGAAIGDILSSIIETCCLNKVNPFDYLMALMKNARDVRAHPELWLAWNYQLQKSKVA